MKKISAIEGFRGWLAWMVVLAHVVEVVDAQGVWHILGEMGHPAVIMFVIVSEFVITHRVIERPEPYPIYVLRRFMRIFLLFSVSCFFGFFFLLLFVWSLSL